MQNEHTEMTHYRYSKHLIDSAAAGTKADSFDDWLKTQPVEPRVRAQEKWRALDQVRRGQTSAQRDQAN